jgi:D-alanine transaminase
MNTVYLNGQFLPLEQASVSPLDRGFLFGDGVYEVIPVYRGHPFGLEDHLDRLFHSLEAIQIPNPYAASEWTNLIQAVLDKNGPKADFSLYCQVTRGFSPKRQLQVSTILTPTVFIMATPYAYPSVATLSQGIKAIVMSDLRSQHTHIKSTSLLASTLMRLEAQKADASEIIIVHQDLAIEAASSYLFLVKIGVLYTPPKSPRLVAGVTRDKILTLAEQLSIPIREEECPVEALFSADEVWVSGSTKEIVPVIQIDDARIGTGQAGPIWYKIIAAYKALIDANSIF